MIIAIILIAIVAVALPIAWVAVQRTRKQCPRCYKRGLVVDSRTPVPELGSDDGEPFTPAAYRCVICPTHWLTRKGGGLVPRELVDPTFARTNR